MPAYYNEIDAYAAQWLRNLIAAGHIAPGDVDERDIRDVKTSDLVGYSQCHFFAGIGGWSLALRLAGWPDDRPVWTGSCPCQPFSTAGKRAGFADERHLWPDWNYLISQRRPAVVFGEQVARGSGLWLDAVCNDMEDQGYAVGAAVLPACSVGAPHLRERLWFVANANLNAGVERGIGDAEQGPRGWDADRSGVGSYVADSISAELRQQPGRSRREDGASTPLSQQPCWWDVEPGMGRVAHGVPNRVGRLRAYGNAIVPQVAAEFISAYLDRRN